MIAKDRKDMILSKIHQAIQRNNMSMGQVHLMLQEKGFDDKRTKDFFSDAGVAITYEEFLDVVKEIGVSIDLARKDLDSKKAKEEAPPSLEDIMKKGNVITNEPPSQKKPIMNEDMDILTKLERNEVIQTNNASYMTLGIISEDEPPAEEVELPSQGRFYNNVLKATNGKLLIRPMTLKEEKIMTTERFLKTGEAFDMIFRNCIKTAGIDTTNLLSSDRVFLLFYLRAISYGPEYNITAYDSMRNACEIKLNISDLEITHPPKAFQNEPFSITLPVSGKTMALKLSRGVDESAIITKKSFKTKEDSNDFAERLLQLTVDIEGVARPKWESFITNLIGKDLSHIRKTFEAIDFGYKVNSIYTSPYTGEELKVALTVNESFFRSE